MIKNFFTEEGKKKYLAVLILIILIGAALRLIGANWGMPANNLHPDEGIIFEKAFECAVNNTFEVGDYYYRPNHVTIKINTVLYLFIQKVFFSSRGMDNFPSNFTDHFTVFATASRLITALFGIGIVILTYLITRLWGKKQALIATFIAAVFPAFIEHSHYITPDIPLLFFLMLVLYFGLLYQKTPSVLRLFWMAFFTAVATCEKYTGVFGCLIIAIAVISTHKKKISMIIKHGLLAIFFFIMGIMAVSPVLIIDYRDVLEAMRGQNHSRHLGGDGLNFPQTIWYYLKTTGIHLGLVFTLSSIWGIVAAFKKNAKATILLLTFFAYLFPTSVLKIHWERYTLPIYEVGIVFSAIGVVDVIEFLNKKLQNMKPLKIATNLVIFALPVCSLVIAGIAYTARFLAPDSRIYNQPIFAAMGITTANSTYECNTPFDPGNFYSVYYNFEGGELDQFKWGAQPKYVITSSGERDLYLNGRQDWYGIVSAFYNKLDEEYPLIYKYTGEIPESYFFEVQNIFCSVRSICRYLKGTASGFEIRVYQLY